MLKFLQILISKLNEFWRKLRQTDYYLLKMNREKKPEAKNLVHFLFKLRCVVSCHGRHLSKIVNGRPNHKQVNVAQTLFFRIDANLTMIEIFKNYVMISLVHKNMFD
jgi:hypothetical protein